MKKLLTVPLGVGLSYLRLAIRQAIANEDSPHSRVSSRYTQLVTPVVQPMNGYFTAPETPGIGVDLTDYVLEHSDIESVR